MDDVQLLELEKNLRKWFDDSVGAIEDVAGQIEGLDDLRIKFGSPKSEEFEVKLDTPEEVSAFRMGLLSAIGSLGEFPLEVSDKNSEETS